MGEGIGVKISDGRLKGPTVEKIFFSNSREQLQRFWGLKDLGELRRADPINLPQEALEYVVSTTKQTISDGRERAAVFGHSGSKVIINKEMVGNDSFKAFINSGSVKNIGATIWSENSLIFNYNRLFGRPEPIYYHCHPGLTSSDITSAGITLNGGERVEVAPEDFIRYINLRFGAFSDTDLETFFGSNRYVNSALLGSIERILYIAPPEFYISLSRGQFNHLHTEYKSAMDDVLLAALSWTFGIPTEKLAQQTPLKGYDFKKSAKAATKILEECGDEQGIKKARDKVLVDTCNKAGYVCFVSHSLESGVLKRLEFQNG
ncbi:MAG: hypothetical protein M1484_04920 [Patescibacteria group bacterium]|nr:hypothetical protein [Patescibacteria group bacterium]